MNDCVFSFFAVYSEARKSWNLAKVKGLRKLDVNGRFVVNHNCSQAQQKRRWNGILWNTMNVFKRLLFLNVLYDCKVCNLFPTFESLRKPGAILNIFHSYNCRHGLPVFIMKFFGASSSFRDGVLWCCYELERKLNLIRKNLSRFKTELYVLFASFSI